MLMSDRDSVRDALFQHSDSRPCRLVWAAVDDTQTTPDDIGPRDYVEVLRVTDGAVCLVGSEDQADLYVRWDGSRGQFVYVAFWPPWGVVDAGATDRDGAVALVTERDGPAPVHVAETPFGNGGPAADLSGLV
jgi:hypothetical protein